MVGGVYITCQAAHLVRGELELEHRLPTFNTPSTIPKYNIHTNTYKTILLCLTYIHFQIVACSAWIIPERVLKKAKMYGARKLLLSLLTEITLI